VRQLKARWVRASISSIRPSTPRTPMTLQMIRDPLLCRGNRPKFDGSISLRGHGQRGFRIHRREHGHQPQLALVNLNILEACVGEIAGSVPPSSACIIPNNQMNPRTPRLKGVRLSRAAISAFGRNYSSRGTHALSPISSPEGSWNDGREKPAALCGKSRWRGTAARSDKGDGNRRAPFCMSTNA
jgi:hypothetical protein